MIFNFANINEFVKSSINGRVLCLDVGTKKIGYSISDESLILSVKSGVFLRTKSINKDSLYISEMAIKNNCSCIVAGWPIELSGKEGYQCIAVLEFLNKIKNINILLYDERFSSKIIERDIWRINCSKEKKIEMLNAGSASYILQSFLDYIKKV